MLEELPWAEDPQPKLERARNRKVTLPGIFEGIFRCWEDVEAVFNAEALYENFKNPVLGIFYQEMEECQRGSTNPLQWLRILG